MRNNYSRRHDDVLNHSAKPSPLHRALHGDVSHFEAGLSNYSENVVRKLHQFKHKFICIELARGKLFGTKVCFDLAVILLHLTVLVVKLYDIFVRKINTDRVHIAFNLGCQVHLPVVVAGAFGDVIDRADFNGFLFFA